jgi:predicted regulator of Ras-like GTPase activity (Roadblock/LC7/MglB family)
MFDELLNRVLTNTPGAVSVTLMGFDGIAIDTQESGTMSTEAQASQIELANIAKQLRSISEGMGTGDVHEVALQTGGLTTVLRPLTEEYFVAVSMTPGGLLGKGRYLLRVIAPKLVEQLVL